MIGVFVVNTQGHTGSTTFKIPVQLACSFSLLTFIVNTYSPVVVGVTVVTQLETFACTRCGRAPIALGFTKIYVE